MPGAPSIQVLRFADHRRMPWRNGGGVTYEVLSSPAASDLADFEWRISIAEVEAGGPFSAFPGIDRTIVLVEGEWMALTVDGRRHRLGVREPFSFDGGSETMCEVAGRCRDLNVMTRRGHASASVSIIAAGRAQHEPADGSTVVLVCLSGGVVLTDMGTGDIELGMLDAAVSTDRASPTIGGDGAVAMIRLRPMTT